MHCRGIRGATTADTNTPDAILAATRELLEAIRTANNLDPSDIATARPSPSRPIWMPRSRRRLRGRSAGPCPLLDAVEIGVPGSLPRCIRVLLHWNTDLPPYGIRHIYLRQATQLRPDLQADEAVPAPPANGAPATTPAAVPALSGPSGAMVAYQGEPGAYSQEAIYQHFGPGVGTLPCHAFDDIFAAVEEGQRNARVAARRELAGRIDQPGVRSAAGPRLACRGRGQAPGAPLPAGATRRPRWPTSVSVRSHPQALAQCERYLRNRGLGGGACLRHGRRCPRAGRQARAWHRRHRQRPGRRRSTGWRCWTRTSRIPRTTRRASSCWAARSRRLRGATRRPSSLPRCTPRVPCTMRWANLPAAAST